MNRPLFFANWKMNHGPTEARAYMTAFLRIFAPRDDRTVAMFPPALSLSATRDARGDRTDIHLGVQNIFEREKGAFTGENSAPIARDAGAELVLVGHSERRHVFGETNLEVAQKVAIAPQFGLTPVLCVGETLAQRQMDAAEAIVMEQLEIGISTLAKASTPQTLPLIVAYEPVWAIGTGHSATPEDAASMHRVIRDKLGTLAPHTDEIPILYGGSVKPANARELMSQADVDGALVGGAALEARSFADIIKNSI